MNNPIINHSNTSRAYDRGYQKATIDIVAQIRKWANGIPFESEVKDAALRMAAEIEKPGSGLAPIQLISVESLLAKPETDEQMCGKCGEPRRLHRGIGEPCP